MTVNPWNLGAKWLTLALVVVLASLAVFLAANPVWGQSDGPIEFPENSKDPVATFTATDPEGATPVAWDIVEDASDPDSGGDLLAADNADAASFTIDKDGALKFSSPPDFENPAGTNATENTYKVVVVACDVALDAGGACPAHRQSWLPRGYRQGHQRGRARHSHLDHLHDGWNAAVPGRRNPDGHCIRWRHNTYIC